MPKCEKIIHIMCELVIDNLVVFNNNHILFIKNIVGKVISQFALKFASNSTHNVCHTTQNLVFISHLSVFSLFSFEIQLSTFSSASTIFVDNFFHFIFKCFFFTCSVVFPCKNSCTPNRKSCDEISTH